MMVVIVVIYIYIYKYLFWYNSFVILLMLLFVIYVYSMENTIFIYCMVERRYEHIVSLLLPILLLLIVIYDSVGTYNETIIKDWYVDDDDDVPVPILSRNDNYCTFIPSSFVFIGGGGDGYVYIYIYI